MGACCTCQIIKGQKFDELPGEDDEDERDLEGEEIVGHGDYGAHIRLKGSSKFTSMFTQQGRKGVNQDAMTVWENFTGDRDAIFCGVFDGHGPSGHKVARHIRDTLPSKLSASIKQRHVNTKNDINGSNSDHADDPADTDNHGPLYSFVKASLIESFKTVDEDLEAEDYIDSYCSGATAVSVLRKGKHLMIANLGDSRAILCTRGNRNQLVAVQLTVDLKPNLPSECERITKCSGRVLAMEEEPTVFRVWMPDQDCPGLAMARAFGDFCLKDYGLISVPEVFYRRLTEKDEFVVLASDGIWDVLSNDEVVRVVASARKRSMAARLLVDRAVQAWKYKFPGARVDDCAVICLFFKIQQPSLRKSMSEVTQLSLNYSELGSQFQPAKLATEDGLETVLDCHVGEDSNPEAAARKDSAYTHRTGLISTSRKPSRDYISVEN